MEILYKKLEKTLGVTIKDKKLLQNAFIHRSYLNEHKDFELPSNEKLEFLGDSVLSLITSIYLYKHYPELQEGDYTDIKAAIVRTESLARAALEIQVGTYLFLSKGQEQEGGRANTNILADTFEALIAVIFIDKNFDAAYDFVLTHLFKDNLTYIIANKLYLSPKSRLQEYIQARHKVTPQYKVIEETGPDHKRTFKVIATLNEEVLGTGEGKSKKEAEEAAAQNAFDNLK